MDRFHVIQDAAVILVRASVYKQAAVYQRAGALYCGHGGGFVRLYENHNTGVPSLRWDDIELPGVASVAQLEKDGLGKLALPPAVIKQIEGRANES